MAAKRAFGRVTIRAAAPAGLAAALVTTLGCAVAPQAAAQDIGFGLADSYRYYADPGNGGGSAYAPFFDPYRGNRIVRGAYPDAYYDGHGYHYGKSAPPSLYVEPPPYLRGDRPRLRVGETMTTPVEPSDRIGEGVRRGRRHRPPCARVERCSGHGR